MEVQTALTPSIADRIAARQRPAGWPLMHQTWGKLLFIHWPIPAELLRPKTPPQLEIDTYEGQAWIAITPFTMWNIRPSFFPPLPFLSQAHELNVRTYVYHGRVPGVWFFSLDINHALAVPLARTLYHLPYFKACINMTQQGDSIDYRLRRDATMQFDAKWSCGASLAESKPDSLEYFLTERYCLYSARGGDAYRARIWHELWPLQSAKLDDLRSTMIESHGLPTPQGPPLLHYSNRIDVEIWPLKKIAIDLKRP